MKVVSFNVNGVRARQHQMKALTETLQPDVIGLQETKVVDAEFPAESLRELGYEPNWFGQKGHYGVALLTKEKPLEVMKGFPTDDAKAQRRMIGVTLPFAGTQLKILNGYFPQGESRSHPQKFPNKQKFYADLMGYLNEACNPSEPLLIIGDMNIAPTDGDIGIGASNAKRWLREGKCSFLPEEREWMAALKDWGLTDTFREKHPDVDDRFSWFDYRSRGFDRDPKRGLRIDLILATRPMMERLVEVGIDYELRGMEKPSDHCPVWARFDRG